MKKTEIQKGLSSWDHIFYSRMSRGSLSKYIQRELISLSSNKITVSTVVNEGNYLEIFFMDEENDCMLEISLILHIIPLYEEGPVFAYRLILNLNYKDMKSFVSSAFSQEDLKAIEEILGELIEEIQKIGVESPDEIFKKLYWDSLSDNYDWKAILVDFAKMEIEYKESVLLDDYLIGLPPIFNTEAVALISVPRGSQSSEHKIYFGDYEDLYERFGFNQEEEA